MITTLPAFRFLVLPALLATTLPGASGSLTAAEAPLMFEKDIRPIFREFCFDCHGATEKLDGGLDLRLVRFMERGGESGPAIVKGQPKDSYLLNRVVNGEMPPGGHHVPAEKVAILERWLAAGAPTARPEPETLAAGVPISEEERAFWAFRPIQQPQIPTLAGNDRIRTPIDALLRQSMPAGLEFSPDADRPTLVRRLYFDLIGLPPTAEELNHWTQLESDDWYPQLVDTLLDSPHYGERWARHWLDVVGYADSEGATLNDVERPWAWKYRDYVIQSLNKGKPFDRFILEQLAGDELAGPKNGDWTPEQIELLTATGFLRMAADGTGSGDNSPEARNKVIADTLKIVGNSLLGLSLNCAQCHDHRYDPIPHTDYFAIRAVFEPAMNWQAWQAPQARQVSLYTQADRARAAEIEQEAQTAQAERNAKQDVYMQQALDKELEKFEEPLRGELRTAYETPEKDRTDAQKMLLDKHPSVKITPGVLYQYLPDAAEDLKKLDAKISGIRSKKAPEEFVRALTEPASAPPETRLFHRGDHNQLMQVIHPGGLSVLAAGDTRVDLTGEKSPAGTTGRRTAFAKWLTGAENPLTARVIVNRIWMHHFGRGLVSTPADFGRLGTAPTHPELLDWLAGEFRNQGWSLKQLHRVILASTAWRQSAVRDPAKNAIDPENRYYWRKSLQRLDAEILRDRMLAVSGTLDRQVSGRPVAIKEDETGQVLVDGQQTRRSLYIRVRRTQPVAMLQTFDAPVMEINCEARPVSTVATQSLMLLNGEFTLEQAGRFADRVMAETPAGQKLPESVTVVMPSLPPPAWSYGSGRFDAASQRVADFAVYPNWADARWQGGPKVPDAVTGWSFLNASGGHPGKPRYATVRRWTAAAEGAIRITGTLQHGSENGDGVRGLIISAQAGILGDWIVKHGSMATGVNELHVRPGETIDFLTDCQQDENSDSFNWPVELTQTLTDGTTRTFNSAADFRGPAPSAEQLPSQVYHAWQVALCRNPSDAELQLALTFCAGQLAEMNQNPQGIPKDGSATRQVLVNLCQMLLNSNEFVYVD